ncbi:MAG: DUF4105 domain-containing protein [Xanthomonadales bacterium]|nr:DUF4105 domain-containing protein [Xanthomonadales bacterium]
MTAPARATLPAPPPAPAIELATMAPGEIYWQRFGHNALLVGGPDGVSYNFGYFDFDQPGFLRRFALGRMLYQALALPAPLDLRGYREEDRSVVLQSLALDPVQSARLRAELAEAVRPENRDYLYEYFRANCSTRIRDAIDRAVDGELRRQTAGRSRGFTYRMHAVRLAEGSPWLATVIDLGLGPDADRRLSFWEEMFIPEMLRHYLPDIVLPDGRPLVGGERTWFEGGSAPPPLLPADRRLPFATAGVLLAMLILTGGRRAAAGSRRWRRGLALGGGIWHLLAGLAGLVLLLLWTVTDHVAAHGNENLFLLSPLSLLLAWPWWRQAAAGRRPGLPARALAWLVLVSALLGLAAKALPQVFAQANLHWALLLVPVQVAWFVAWRRLADAPVQADASGGRAIER